MDDVRTQLRGIAGRVAAGRIDTAKPWGGAGVVISPTDLQEKSGDFYPEPRVVVTALASELSWLFEQLRGVFAHLLDGTTKIEFFGRLANAALRYQRRCDGKEVLKDLLAAVLHEAFAIADEMEEGSFEFFAVALGNEIVDDYIDEAERGGFLGIEETRAYFAAKGIELG